MKPIRQKDFIECDFKYNEIYLSYEDVSLAKEWFKREMDRAKKDNQKNELPKIAEHAFNFAKIKIDEAFEGIKK